MPSPLEVVSGLRLGNYLMLFQGHCYRCWPCLNPTPTKTSQSQKSGVLEFRLQLQVYPPLHVILWAVLPVCFFLGRPGEPQPRPL